MKSLALSVLGGSASFKRASRHSNKLESWSRLSSCFFCWLFLGFYYIFLGVDTKLTEASCTIFETHGRRTSMNSLCFSILIEQSSTLYRTYSSKRFVQTPVLPIKRIRVMRCLWQSSSFSFSSTRIYSISELLSESLTRESSFVTAWSYAWLTFRSRSSWKILSLFYWGTYLRLPEVSESSPCTTPLCFYSEVTSFYRTAYCSKTCLNILAWFCYMRCIY